MTEMECNAEIALNVLSEEVKRISSHKVELYVKETIYKVPEYLRRRNEGAYTPNLLSIGPYHHGAPALAEMEDTKLRHFVDFTHRSRDTFSEYIDVVVQNIDKVVKEYSARGLSVDDPTEFVKMMVVDCCFVIEFLVKWFLCDRKSQAKTLMTKLPMLRNDLLLVENQVPFFLLELMFTKLDATENTYGNNLRTIALAFFLGDRDGAQAWVESNRQEKFDHLLHLYHTSLTPPSRRYFGWIRSCFGSGRRMNHSPTLKWIGLNPQPKILLWGIPNACNLRDTGFSFQKKYAREYDFLNVSRRGNKIKIPAVCIRESMLILFRNLVALEQCSNEYGNHFTAYAMFMDYLIDTREDVAMLKECGVIDNRLGDDQKVADFFNDLCNGLHLEVDKHYLSALFNHVTEYYTSSKYKVRLFRCLKRFVPDLFTNPWAIPSIIVAAILLVLSALQTFYAVYAYYRPPRSTI